MIPEYPESVVRIAVPVAERGVDLLTAGFRAAAQSLELPPADAEAIVTAVREAAQARCNTGTGTMSATLNVTATPLEMILSLDDTVVLRIAGIEIPTTNPSEETVAHLGVGLQVSKALLDDIEYTPGTDGHRWKLIKRLPGNASTNTPLEPVRLTLPAEPRFLGVLGETLSTLICTLPDLENAETLAYNVQLAAHEIAANILQHAYDDAEGRLIVTIITELDRLEIEMEDTGTHTFDFEAAIAPPKKRLSDWVGGGGLFAASSLIVNGGNYLINLLMGRQLGPAAFADLTLIVNMMMVLSAIPATLEQTMTRFVSLHLGGGSPARAARLRRWLLHRTWVMGVLIGLALLMGASLWQRFFHTESAIPFIILGMGIPFFLTQGVERGGLRGRMNFGRLAVSYQTEMWVRLVGSVALVALGLSVNGAVFALALSFLATWWIARGSAANSRSARPLPDDERTALLIFARSVLYTEVGTILVRNTDTLIVKHFFLSAEAGQYAALALVARIVYFITWPLTLTMFPTVTRRKSQGEPYRHLYWLTLGLVATCAVVMLIAVFWVPELIIGTLFGPAYIAAAPLLGPLTLATALYALSDVIINFRLSVGDTLGTLLDLGGGLVLVSGLWLFHTSLTQLVWVQAIVMAALFVILLIWDTHLAMKERRTPVSV